MTLIIALNCRDAKEPGKRSLLFAADKQSSTPFIKMEANKIRRIYNIRSGPDMFWGLLFAGSGDSLILDEMWYKIDKYVHENEELQEIEPINILRNHREAFGELAYDTYNKYFARCETTSEQRNIKFDFLLGANDGNTPTILYVNYRGNTRIEDNFKIIGQGLITGGELLLNELYKKDLNFREAAILATFVINRVSNIDVSVGGGIDWYLIRENVPQAPTEEFFNLTSKKAEDNWEIIKRIFWKISDDDDFRIKINDILKTP